MDLKLPFGLKNNQLVHVSDVESGLECECRCPACRHPLVARKGEKYAHHFAHDKSSQCKDAYETAMHIAAKEVVKKAGYIRIPKLEYEVIATRRKESHERIVRFDKIDAEKKYRDIIPDILIEQNGRTLAIEIYVTHPLDEQKIKKIRENDLSTIEVDLSKVGQDIDFEALKKIVVDSVEHKKWIFNSKRRELHNRILKYSKEKPEIPHGFIGSHVDDCPKPGIRGWNGKPQASVRHDCFGCEFYVNPESQYRDDDCNHNYHEEGTIYCIGHRKEEDIEKLLII